MVSGAESPAAPAAPAAAGEGAGAKGGAREDEDLYIRMKQLQRQLEFLEIQEEYIKARRAARRATRRCAARARESSLLCAPRVFWFFEGRAWVHTPWRGLGARPYPAA